MLAMGFAVVACEADAPAENANTDPKTIIVTDFYYDIPHHGKAAVLSLSSSVEDDVATASGGVPVESGALSIDLTTVADNPWRGTGTYYLLLIIGTVDPITFIPTKDAVFVWTNGTPPNPERSNIPKYRVTKAQQTVSFTEFFDITPSDVP